MTSESWRRDRRFGSMSWRPKVGWDWFVMESGRLLASGTSPSREQARAAVERVLFEGVH